MRVVFADNVADRTRRLAVRTGRRDAAVVHCIQDAAVHGLEAVAHVRKGARHDDAHRILEKRRAHLLAKLGGFDSGGAGIDIVEVLFSHDSSSKVEVVGSLIKNAKHAMFHVKQALVETPRKGQGGRGRRPKRRHDAPSGGIRYPGSARRGRASG